MWGILEQRLFFGSTAEKERHEWTGEVHSDFTEGFSTLLCMFK